MTEQQMIMDSIELHLFYGRLMKEHTLFLESGFSPKDTELARTANRFRTEFDKLMLRAIRYSAGVVTPETLRSGELVTGLTLNAERQTQRLTGLPINLESTLLMARFQSRTASRFTPGNLRVVQSMNEDAITLIDGLIGFKTKLLEDLRSCQIFMSLYPLFPEHMLMEAVHYRTQLEALINRTDINDSLKKTLLWDHIMREHALMIRGMLDPSEEELINNANGFAVVYGNLMKKAQTVSSVPHKEIRGETLAETLKFRDFNAAGAKGLAECKIKSVILPLLADHVLREANHFVRVLEKPDIMPRGHRR